MQHSPFRSLGTILQTVVHRHGLASKLLEHQLLQRWPEIAGPQIAAHSRPDQIRFRKLTLFVQSSVWLQQLLFLKASLIEKINAQAGSPIVTDILLRVGEVGEASEAQGGDRLMTPPNKVASSPVSGSQPSESMADAGEHVRTLKDPDLRERLAAMMTSALSSGTATRASVPSLAHGQRRRTGTEPLRPHS
jgi:Dna[CI] antecedent DciA-like protein